MDGKEFVLIKKYAKFTPTRTLGRRFVSIHPKMSNRKTYLPAYWVDGKRKDVTANNMSASLKFTATTLYYTYLKGIPVERVDTHSFGVGGANELLLAGYRERYTQKWVYGEGINSMNIYDRN